MLFADVVRTSAAVRSTRSRKAKIAALAGLLRAAAPAEVGPVTAWLSGELTQGRLGAGWRTLAGLDATPPAALPRISVGAVESILDRVAAESGPGSGARRKDLLAELWSAATAPEQEYLPRLLTGELRQGALTALVAEAVAEAAGVPVALVRRAHMLSGRLPVTAAAALRGGAEELLAFRLEIGRPIQPMLASPGASLEEATAEFDGQVSVEHKLDGARIQVHRAGETVRVFTRTLREITDSVPELVALVRGLDCRSVVLDGETLALTDDGRPRPFQETMSRFATMLAPADPEGAVPAAPSDGSVPAGSAPGGAVRAGTVTDGFAAVPGYAVPPEFDAATARHLPPGAPLLPPVNSTRELLLHPYFFDCLHLDGEDLLDEPLARRREALLSVAGRHTIPALIRPDRETAAEYLDGALAAGHEGLMVKALDAPYAAGRRGRSWLKIKPVHSLDLIVLGAEWGYGRRTGYLSNLHLGAREPRTGEPVMVGKTFKGLTDALLAWQTAEFPRHERARDEHTVYLWPELVVEVALDGVQVSPRYPGGVALRFARVVRYRPDKTADQADTIVTVRGLLP
ncbi:MAG TPA: ATP-dependent DNA ligase [Nocardia sp.]|uniref:ATP-dependent DNA ligase n=1 Tax=Nocardia sp. TaxID=1821 RepID=UPI002B4B1297|nr:ATP-dependent DNA ligase [Nocardia sp.]HLS79594.1 ATP-dependent DNA ligase [Nocardia sp.]